MPEKAEQEAGFQMWLRRIRYLAENSGVKIVVFAPATTMEYLRPKGRKRTANLDFVPFELWDDLPSLEHDLRDDDCLWFVMSRRERVSYHPAMSRIPAMPRTCSSPHTAPCCSIPCRRATPKAGISDGSEV